MPIVDRVIPYAEQLLENQDVQDDLPAGGGSSASGVRRGRRRGRVLARNLPRDQRVERNRRVIVTR